MKVKDFIAQLQTLDQEKDIWFIYDGMPQEPEIEVVTEHDARRECKVGDYAHITQTTHYEAIEN